MYPGLKSLINKKITSRILFCVFLTMIFVLSVTYKIFVSNIDQLKDKIETQCKTLEDFVISQTLVPNHQAIQYAITQVNNNNPFKIEWVNAPLIRNKKFTWNPSLSWKYDWQSRSFENNNFGYFKVTGSFLNDKQVIYPIFYQILVLLLFSALIIIALIPLGRSIPKNLLIDPINTILDLLNKSNANDDTNKRIHMTKEMYEIQAKLSGLIKAAENRSRESASIMLAAQLVHDIRSPLAALNMLLNDLPQITEEKRIILRNAAKRINDIANNLLLKHKNQLPHLESSTEIHPCLIAPIIESIMTEKRLEYRERTILLEENISNDAFFAFSNVNLNEIKRVISNLINNAVEACSDNQNVITVTLEATEHNIKLSIIDNGCGIPSEHLATIFETKRTTKDSGTGLGLSHAKQAIEMMQGKISISSTINQGTSLTIHLPRVIAPGWFASKILINKKMIIAVLDDDDSIHSAWDLRLRSLSDELTILHYRQANDFIQWYENFTHTNTLLFSDYELLGESKSGLDVIEKLKISNQGILITSHYEKPDIIKRCIQQGVRLLPKNLVARVSLALTEEFKTCDYILIEDDKCLTELWKFYADRSSKKIAIFASKKSAEQHIYSYSRNTIIYIDSSLGDGVKGEQYAKILYEAGFKHIYLSTGYEPSHFPQMYWITQIVGKEPPF